MEAQLACINLLKGMPRRRRNSGRRGTTQFQRNNANQITVSGVDIVNLGYSASFSFAQFTVKASAISRAMDFRKLFEEYRLDYFEVETLPACTGPVAFGWVPGSTVASFSSWNNQIVANLSPSTMWYPNQTVPVRFVVPKRMVGQQFNWLLCSDANGPAGTLLIGGPLTTAVTCTATIRWTMSFKGPVAYGFETVDQPLQVVEEKEDDSYTFEPVPSSRPVIVSRGPAVPRK